MTSSGGVRVLSWLGRFLFVLGWLPILAYSGLLGLALPSCGGLYRSLDMALFLFLVFAEMAWPVILPGAVVLAAVLASCPGLFAGRWRWVLKWAAISVASAILLFALVDLFSGAVGSCHLNFF